MDKVLYSDWLHENGVCSSEWDSEEIKKEFLNDSVNHEFTPEFDV